MAVDVKQVIVVRKDLNMRKGKIAAQAAHASMAVLLDMMQVNIEGLYEKRTLIIPNDTALQQWLNVEFKKICVSVDSEEKLLELYHEAKELGIPCSLITDNGRTEFAGVKTNTCIAIGPDYSERVDLVTKHLPLF
jgi:PTH2 family peptidyl-tRNA hydrolase